MPSKTIMMLDRSGTLELTSTMKPGVGKVEPAVDQGPLTRPTLAKSLLKDALPSAVGEKFQKTSVSKFAVTAAIQ